MASPILLNASATRSPWLEPSVTATVASVRVTDEGTSAVTSTWRASTSASALNAWFEGLGLGGDHLAAAGLGEVGQRRDGRGLLLLEGDHVDEHIGVADRSRDVLEVGVAGVGAVGEHEQLALSLGPGHVDAGQHAVVEAGLLGELDALDDRACLRRGRASAREPP